MGGIRSLRRKIKKASHKRSTQNQVTSTFGSASSPQKEILERGIFCDCHGTLYSYSFEKDALLVSYLNAKHAKGVSVTLVSTDPAGVWDKISDIGLHKDLLATLTNKRAYMGGRVLEFLIDDDPMNKAKTTTHPHDEKFRDMMKKFLGMTKPALAPSSL